MKIIGKFIVIVSGLLNILFSGYLLLAIISNETPVLVYSMIFVFLLYMLGLFASIFLGRHRMLTIAVILFVGYLVYEGYYIFLFNGFSQFTLAFGSFFATLIGVMLSKKKKRKEKELY